MMGTPRDHAAAFANDTPTRSEPTRPGPCVTAIAPTSAKPSPAPASAASTTPQMSRTCCREASSGTTPPHSRWISVCDATTFERSSHGRARSPVSLTTAAAVSSHDVSIASTVTGESVGDIGSVIPPGPRPVTIGPRVPASACRPRALGEGGGQGLGERRLDDTPLGDDAGDVAMRRHVERGVADLRADWRQAGGAEVRHLPLVALLDRDVIAVRGREVDGRQRGGDVE